MKSETRFTIGVALAVAAFLAFLTAAIFGWTSREEQSDHRRDGRARSTERCEAKIRAMLSGAEVERGAWDPGSTHVRFYQIDGRPYRCVDWDGVRLDPLWLEQ